MSTFQCEASLFLETLRGVDTDWDAFALVFALCHCLDIIKITNCPRKELQAQLVSYAHGDIFVFTDISTHHWGPLEGDKLESRFASISF